VLHVASECAPFAKTGGLGDVVGALPIAQREIGIDARVVLPLYAGIDWNAQERLPQTLVVPMAGRTEFAGLRRGHLPNSSAPIYFVEHHGYFDRGGIYGDRDGEFSDNLTRFAFLSRAAFAVARSEGFVPDIIHAHDWQTALVPAYVNTVEWGTPFHAAATVLSIHNLGYQGLFASDAFPGTGLGWEHFHQGEFAHRGGNAVNLLKGGLAHAGRVVAVSPTYAEEIMGDEHGAGLQGFLRHHSRKVSGILNGIDAEVWNPATDRHLPAHFDAHHLGGKAHCKAELQRELGLPVRDDVPLFGVVSRFTSQKGLDYLVSILPRLLDWNIQLVVVGTGDKSLEQAFRIASLARPDKMASVLTFSDPLAHRVEAAADFFLMPSRYEPCGMNQMYSLRYGTLPIVHRTGGLADTVWNFREDTGEGTGFVMNHLSAEALYGTIGWATRLFFERPYAIARMRQVGMGQDFGWGRAARKYEDLYLSAYAERRGHGFFG
jgi:starch synthase